jgi:1-acyl-sn-glycerol-3-phosphate acyltransferase
MSEETPFQEWHYEPASDLDQSWVERLRNTPRDPDMIVYGLRSAAALLLRAWLRIYHRFEVRGHEHLPKEGSFVLVCNHSSHLDALCLLSALPLKKIHHTFPAAAEDYFFVGIARLWLSAILLNAIPFKRKAGASHSIETCRALLENGRDNVLILFPEGTRTTTGRMGSFKPGIGLLAAGSLIPVVPCFLEGAFQAWRKGSPFPLPRKLILHIGNAKCYSDAQATKAGALTVSEDLQNIVSSLISNPTVKEGL